jgi:hypothetical protein
MFTELFRGGKDIWGWEKFPSAIIAPKLLL